MIIIRSLRKTKTVGMKTLVFFFKWLPADCTILEKEMSQKSILSYCFKGKGREQCIFQTQKPAWECEQCLGKKKSLWITWKFISQAENKTLWNRKHISNRFIYIPYASIWFIICNYKHFINQLTRHIYKAH